MIIKKQFLLNKDILSDGNHPLHPKPIAERHINPELCATIRVLVEVEADGVRFTIGIQREHVVFEAITADGCCFVGTLQHNYARQFALNRVIMGRHWKSDIDAGLMLAAALFSDISTCEAYQKQLIKAKAEYESIR